MQPNLRYVYSFLALLTWLQCQGFGADPAAEFPGTAMVTERATTISSQNRWNGWAYVISGGVTLAVSIPGYYLSEDIFARAVYSVGQALGVGTVGYGTYLILIENEYASFEKIVGAVPELNAKQREHMSMAFLTQNADRARNIRRLRVITHSLMAGLNILSGSTTSHSDLKTALYFLGGVNLIAAGSFLFGSSEDEEILKKIPRLSIGPAPKVTLAFTF